MNIVRCENTAVKRRAFASVHTGKHLEWLHVKYLLSIFTADYLPHLIQVEGVGCRNHMGVAHSYCYKLLAVPIIPVVNIIIL